MQTTPITEAAAAVPVIQAAVLAAYAADPRETDATAAMAGGPFSVIVNGMQALWARARTLDQAGLDALDSACAAVVAHNFQGLALAASDIRVAIAMAPDAASISGGPPQDSRFVALPPEPEDPPMGPGWQG